MTDDRPLADALRADLVKPLAEDALVERVASAIGRAMDSEGVPEYPMPMAEMAAAAIAAVRAHDAGMPCGHCTPNSDEVRCVCEIEETHNDR